MITHKMKEIQAKEEQRGTCERGKEKRVRNNYAGGSFCIIFAFLRHVGRCRMHFSKKGDLCLKTLFSVFLAIKKTFFGVFRELKTRNNVFSYPHPLPGPHTLSDLEWNMLEEDWRFSLSHSATGSEVLL